MKKIIKTVLIVILCVAICASGGYGIYYGVSYKKINPKQTLSITSIDGINVDGVTLTAHRGMSATEPENTLPAFKAACEAGFDFVEFDITPTADGKWVVMHDNKLKRTANSKKLVTDSTFEEISQLHITNGANIEKYTDLKIPTLEETMELLDEYYPEVRPMIEIKKSGADKVDSLVEFFKDYAAKGRSTVVISFDKTVIETLSRECPEQTYWLLSDQLTDETFEFCSTHEGVWMAFNGNYSGNTDSKIQQYIDADIQLAAWTINKPETLKHLYDLGVRYFTTECIIP